MLLTKTDIHNLLVFLKRVQLTGEEAITYVELLQKIQALNEGEENA